MMEQEDAMLDRYMGCLYGLACGDAVGTSVEFSPRGSFAELTDMVGGGPFHLTAGWWTDDTSMALCLAESLCARRGFDARDQMGRYVNWWKWGYLSSTGTCFDIGMTVCAALQRFIDSNEPMSGSASPATAGNGSLMRLAPVPMLYRANRKAVAHFCQESSRTTHAAPEALECCALFGLLICNALTGSDKESVFEIASAPFVEPKVIALAERMYRDKPREQIKGSGYCVESLEAALWCFESTSSFEAAVLRAANLGDDADTTAAIVGQLAGAFYGLSRIPASWRQKLYLSDDIKALATSLYQLSLSEAIAA